MKSFIIQAQGGKCQNLFYFQLKKIRLKFLDTSATETATATVMTNLIGHCTLFNLLTCHFRSLHRFSALQKKLYAYETV
jgi:hypothetical protein